MEINGIGLRSAWNRPMRDPVAVRFFLQTDDELQTNFISEDEDDKVAELVGDMKMVRKIDNCKFFLRN